MMYYVPELTNGYNFKTSVNHEDVRVCLDLYGKEKEVCSAEFQDIVNIVKPDIRVPVHPYDALLLFNELHEILEEYV